MRACTQLHVSRAIGRVDRLGAIGRGSLELVRIHIHRKHFGGAAGPRQLQRGHAQPTNTVLSTRSPATMRALRNAWNAVALEHIMMAASAALTVAATGDSVLRAGATTYSA